MQMKKVKVRLMTGSREQERVVNIRLPDSECKVDTKE